MDEGQVDSSEVLIHADESSRFDRKSSPSALPLQLRRRSTHHPIDSGDHPRNLNSRSEHAPFRRYKRLKIQFVLPVIGTYSENWKIFY